MNFKDMDIKSCYESGVDDIIEDYYVPVLGASVKYDRIAGFFSSATIAVAARGVANFITNGGKMRLITSPRLDKDDIDMITKTTTNSPTISLKDFDIDVENIIDEFEKNHVKALGWMLSLGLLEMKLAIIYNDDGTICNNEVISEKGLFHQKVGILQDKDGNELSFSGSINETAAAWANNDEEFKVFKEWTESNEYYKKDKQRFEEIWSNKRKNVVVYDLPNAVKADIIRYSSDFDIESISVKKYRRQKYLKYNFSNNKKLFFYQADALNKWKNNHYQLLFEMATGTGKTRTAIAGIDYLIKIKKRLITIISTPQNTLSKQWKNEVEAQSIPFDESVLVDGSVTKWDNLLLKLLLKNATGIANHICLYTTHNTASSDKFTNLMTNNIDADTDVLFIGDETHWLGAKKLQKALLPCYKYRIGLSATPSRWFDDSGTNKLTTYYGNKNFEFTIKDALREYNPLTGMHFLVNYYYHISKVALTESESEEYKDLTAKIGKLWRLKDKSPENLTKLERLVEKRANIIKNASAKYIELENILDNLKKDGRIENVLIFVSPQQISSVLEILNKKGLIFHKLTEKEGTKPEKRFGNVSEREQIILKFKEKEYQALVAIKCMDEGIDIPTADVGILMASGTNPREYVQRIGRIIRQSPNKRFAKLYDICVDTLCILDDNSAKLERQIRSKEQLRLKEIAENSINSIDALTTINSLD
ncbi:DEAD/DEAH box helicase family protein [uncultured Bacteroides sp.]|jgi:superfamily II DNA or RNA helicase|uniref:DEAD/DEAH box helicase family protein n=1 Tax=uncultured Bacteroides sp. TaxID=162156 RepID=UPI0025DECF1E|nr:DEAD/DEAH box helicase family protein [uncultured Bacteroides sp.]